jgi:hypothetical protein
VYLPTEAVWLPAITTHECSIALNNWFIITLTMPARGVSRVPTLTIHHGLASGDAPVVLSFPDGTTFKAPPMLPRSPVQAQANLQREMNIQPGMGAWEGEDAQAILQHLRTAHAVRIQYRTSSRAVTLGIQTAGVHTETFSYAHFASAWKTLSDAIFALPVFPEPARVAPAPARSSRDLPAFATPRR